MDTEETYLVRFLLPLGWRSLSAEGGVESSLSTGSARDAGNGEVLLGDVVGAPGGEDEEERPWESMADNGD